MASQQPIPIVPGPALFVDDYLIEESRGLTRTTHQPRKLATPILEKRESWHQQPLFFQKVLRDPSTGRFRMWYNIKNPDGEPRVCYAYAESEDGIEWQRPNLGLVEVAGSTNNNLIDAPRNFGLFLVDEGPVCPDPGRRYKMAYFAPGLGVAFSSDGMRFSEHPGNPVIPYGADDTPVYEPGYENVISDIVDGCWDPLRQQYLLACKIERGGYPGAPHHHAEGWRRTVGMSVSEDFVHWRTPWSIVLPDPDNGIEEFYGFQPMVRGNLYLGFVRVLRDDLPADGDGPVNGVGWTELITSRDGENWTRYQEPFVDRNPDPGTWDRAMAWVGDCVTVGDEEFVYFCGYSAGHKVGDRANGLARLRKDGFVSRDAGPDGGSLSTRLLNLQGAGLSVNARIDGEMQVRLLDENGAPLPGFDGTESGRIRGDSVAHRVEFDEPLAALGGRPARLEFAVKDAQLYGFELAAD